MHEKPLRRLRIIPAGYFRKPLKIRSMLRVYRQEAVIESVEKTDGRVHGVHRGLPRTTCLIQKWLKAGILEDAAALPMGRPHFVASRAKQVSQTGEHISQITGPPSEGQPVVSHRRVRVLYPVLKPVLFPSLPVLFPRAARFLAGGFRRSRGKIPSA